MIRSSRGRAVVLLLRHNASETCKARKHVLQYVLPGILQTDKRGFWECWFYRCAVSILGLVFDGISLLPIWWVRSNSHSSSVHVALCPFSDNNVSLCIRVILIEVHYSHLPISVTPKLRATRSIVMHNLWSVTVIHPIQPCTKFGAQHRIFLQQPRIKYATRKKGFAGLVQNALFQQKKIALSRLWMPIAISLFSSPNLIYFWLKNFLPSCSVLSFTLYTSVYFPFLTLLYSVSSSQCLFFHTFAPTFSFSTGTEYYFFQCEATRLHTAALQFRLSS